MQKGHSCRNRALCFSLSFSISVCLPISSPSLYLSENRIDPDWVRVCECVCVEDLHFLDKEDDSIRGGGKKEKKEEEDEEEEEEEQEQEQEQEDQPEEEVEEEEEQQQQQPEEEKGEQEQEQE
ncbi:hypothetical protein ElyMa_001179200 [Elysia marginata]|uniref:Uncharacterized protein n=1 Tax=Elysia marginata TaxID=1093978 RepID=A0AAV4I4R5_9GAST|nr:hypothetical protein ElyMa_001179200 [Elysia marginata]